MRIYTVFYYWAVILGIVCGTLSDCYAQRTYGSGQQTGATGVLCANCVVNNAANAADGNLQTFSTIRVTLGVLAQTYQEVIFSAPVGANVPVSLKLGSGDDLLSLQALGAISLRPYNGATPAGPAVTANSLLTALSNNNQVELTITPSQAYDRIRVTLNGGLVGALNTIYLYEAYYRGNGPVPCNTAIDELHGISSALLGLGLGVGGVQNPQLAIDGNLATYSTLNAGVGLAGAYAQQTILFQNTSVIGDSVRLTLSLPQTLLDAGVLSNIEISTYNGNISNNDARAFNSSLLNVRLLDLSGNLRTVTVTYAPAATFDRVQLRLGGGIANALSTINLHEAQRVLPRPLVTYNTLPANNVQLCAGSTATLTAAALPNTTFNWYSQPTGGTLLFSGASYTTPALTASATYYVEAVRSGCTDASARTQVSVNVNAIPAAPSITNNAVTVCPGQPATFTAETVAGVSVNWYTTPTGGTPVFTGNSFTTPALTTNATYYAEAIAGGTCVSPTRTQVTATVAPLPSAPVVAATDVTICSGNVAVLNIPAPVSGVQYRWYATATNGTLLYTGNSFTTPALTANTTYYVEAVGVSGCPSASRTQVNVIVQPNPLAPALAANSTTIAAGQTTAINVTNTQTGVTYNWYTSAAAATPVFSGPTYVTPPLYATTTYYVGAVNSTGCQSASRTSITINVNINNNSPCSFANLQSSNINGLCVGCSISNNLLATDADTTTASTISVIAGLTGGFAEQELRFQQPGFAGDTVKLRLQSPVGLADLALLGRIEVALYNGTTEIYRYPLNSSLISLSLLGGNAYNVYVPATAAYDRVTIRLNSGAISALTSLQVYYAMQDFPTPVYTPANTEICRGSSAQINITSPANGGVFNFYDVPTGGTPVYTGTTFNTVPLNTNTTYYVEYTRNGCSNGVRTPIPVMVNDIPAKPVIAQDNVTINSGQTATFVATAPANATVRWYTTPTGGAPVFTGNTFVTPPLNANTTYYAESALGSCVSTDRTPANVTVNQTIPDVTVTPPTRTINAGETASFTASSTTPNVTFNWYTSPTGGVPVFSGANFISPPAFANTTYYAEAVDNVTGIASAARATASITVNSVASNVVPCDAAIDQTTDINGLVCLGCTINNATAAVDNDRNTFSRLNVPVGLLNAYAGQTLRFAHTGRAGDSVVVELGIPGALADVSVLSGISLATYNGNTFNNDRFTVNGSLINVTLLSGQSRFRVAFAAQNDFDRVEIRLNGAVAGVLSALNIYDAYQEVAAPVITTPNVNACEGSQATLTATVPSHVTVKWYTSPSGGSPVFTGSTFTTPALTTSTTYYAEASRTSNGCTQSVRTPVTVSVSPVPAPPVVITPNVTVCTGQAATFTAQNPGGATINWYALPAGGTPLFTGDVYTTPALTTTTSFYAETANGSCVSSSRTQVTATVNATVSDPVVAQNPVQTCSGSAAVLTATSTQPGVIFNWYSTATGGTPVYTGAQFTTPALTANTTYYVEAASGTCISANRVSVDVVVNPTPNAPTVTITPAGGQISSGQTATLTASSTTAGAEFRWYSTASGGSPIATGATFVTPGLSTNTTYYVESVLTATGCTSTSRTPVTVIVNPVFSTTCDFASTQTNSVDGLCLGCSVIDPNNAIDSDTTNYSRLSSTVSLLGSYVSQQLIFNDAGAVGDTVTLRIRVPLNIVAAGVLDRIRISSYNGATFNNDAQLLNSNLVRVQLLAGGQTALVKFAPQAAFDRVEVRLESAVAGLFNNLDIFYATKQVEVPQLAATTQNICSGGSATFTVSNVRAGVQYDWFASPTGGTSLITGPAFTATSLNATTTYYVQSTRVANGCVNPNRVAVTANVTPAPVNPILAQNNVTICAGEQVNLAVTNANGATINWYDAPTGGTLVFTGANFTVSPISTVSYYAEASNGTCTSPARTTATITVNSRPAAPAVASANVQVCQGSGANLAVQNPEAGVTYQWFTVPTGGVAESTGATYATPGITATTTYYIQATGTGGCINNGGRTAVTITPNGQIAAPALSASTTQVCSGGSASLSVVNPVAGLQYNWYTQANGGTPVFTGTTFTVNNLTANATYFVEATNGSGCTSATRTSTSITVQPIPTQPVVQAPAGGMSVCEGSSTTLSIANPQPDLVYRWFNSATGGTLLFTGTIFNTPPLTSNTTYYVEAASAGNCNPSARTAATITVNSLPANVTLVSGNVSICTGASATLSIASPQSGIIYQWFDSPSQTNKVFEGTTFVTGPLAVNTNYYIAAVTTSGCRSGNLTTAQVTILPTPPAPVIANGSTMQACAGTSVTLTISNPEAGFTYRWYNAATGGAAIFTGNSFTPATLSANVTYYAEAVNSGGCGSSSRTPVTITVNPAPAAPVLTAAGASVCAGSVATLAVTPVAGVTVNWFSTATGGTAVASGNTFTTPALNTNTTYYAEAVNAQGCTSGTRTSAIVTIIQPLAAPVVTVGNVTATAVTFQYNSVPGATGYEVSTNNGISFTAPSSGVNGLSHTITGLQPNQLISVIVRAYGASACQLSANSTAVTATTLNPFGEGIYIPNAFSPNGDGQNDILYVYGNVIKSLKFWVYDQYGELQFHTTSKDLGWDGTYRQRAQPVGVYVYYLEAITNDGNLIKKKGTITLLR